MQKNLWSIGVFSQASGPGRTSGPHLRAGMDVHGANGGASGGSSRGNLLWWQIVLIVIGAVALFVALMLIIRWLVRKYGSPAWQQACTRGAVVAQNPILITSQPGIYPYLFPPQPYQSAEPYPNPNQPPPPYPNQFPPHKAQQPLSSYELQPQQPYAPPTHKAATLSMVTCPLSLPTQQNNNSEAFICSFGETGTRGLAGCVVL